MHSGINICGILTLDAVVMCRMLVVDEGHRLKNFNSKLFRELRQLNVEQKLLLTGEAHQPPRGAC